MSDDVFLTIMKCFAIAACIGVLAAGVRMLTMGGLP